MGVASKGASCMPSDVSWHSPLAVRVVALIPVVATIHPAHGLAWVGVSCTPSQARPCAGCPGVGVRGLLVACRVAAGCPRVVLRVVSCRVVVRGRRCFRSRLVGTLAAVRRVTLVTDADGKGTGYHGSGSGGSRRTAVVASQPAGRWAWLRARLVLCCRGKAGRVKGRWLSSKSILGQRGAKKIVDNLPETLVIGFP
jgi:hypothetical protein